MSNAKNIDPISHMSHTQQHTTALHVYFFSQVWPNVCNKPDVRCKSVNIILFESAGQSVIKGKFHLQNDHLYIDY